MAESKSYYIAQRNQTARQITDRKQKNDALAKEIKRLQTAYDQLYRIKKSNTANSETLKKNVSLKKIAGNAQWHGKTRLAFDILINYHVAESAKTFHESIDNMLDEVNTALHKKKGEYDTGVGILNGLNKTWNYFNGIIINWVN